MVKLINIIAYTALEPFRIPKLSRAVLIDPLERVILGFLDVVNHRR